jgi:glycerol-3-phosphate acyltransferase PlsX
MTSVPRIGIDAMGGDFGPRPVAEGAALALRERPGRFRLTLVGDEAEIRAALRHAHLGGSDITVVHASEKVDMAAKAAAAARRSGTSLGVLTQLHKDGALDGIFSAGNTGAVVASALLGLGRLEGRVATGAGRVLSEPRSWDRGSRCRVRTPR